MKKGVDLFIDADDTLWENATFFRNARQLFVNLLVDHGLAEHAVKTELKQNESRRLSSGDFGSRGLATSMHTTARAFGESFARDLNPRFQELADSVRDHDIKLFPQVPETLSHLGQRHRLHLVTMGDHQEQLGKLQRSTVLAKFETFEIMKDKTPQSYEALLRKHGIVEDERSHAWMIGNSLKKDVEPAAAVGLSTAHIPSTVRLPAYFEDSTMKPDLTLDSFAKLREHF